MDARRGSRKPALVNLLDFTCCQVGTCVQGRKDGALPCLSQRCEGVYMHSSLRGASPRWFCAERPDLRLARTFSGPSRCEARASSKSLAGLGESQRIWCQCSKREFVRREGSIQRWTSVNLTPPERRSKAPLFHFGGAGPLVLSGPSNHSESCKSIRHLSNNRHPTFYR